MKIIDSSVEILKQEPGIIGMKKHVEKVGRISHMSDDRITDDSYIKFINLIKENGHWSVFDLGTVYLKVPRSYVVSEENDGSLSKILYYPWTKLVDDSDGNCLITTTYRIIVREDLENFMEKFWCDPDENFFHRATAFFTCSRAVSHQLVRHASLRPNQESQRFNNYSKSKFNGEITYINPEWFKDKKKEKAKKRRLEKWKKDEEDYMLDIKEGLIPEEARGGLPEDAKTSLYMCGYMSDWYLNPGTTGSRERSGFFYLRSDNSAQRDVRVLSQNLEKLFKDNEYDRLK